MASLGQLVWNEGLQASESYSSYSVGDKVRLECSAVNRVPEGRFVWRIGDTTLRNLLPLNLQTRGNDTIVSQGGG